jgi:hypothetical protein
MTKTEALLIELKVLEKKTSTNCDGSSHVLSSQVNVVERQSILEQSEEAGHTIDKCWAQHSHPRSNSDKPKNNNN